MSFNLGNITSISLASPQILAWSIFSRGFGFVSGPIILVFVVTPLLGFVVAKTQQQKSFTILRDAAGNMIPDGPKPLPILGQCLSHFIVRDGCGKVETK